MSLLVMRNLVRYTILFPDATESRDYDSNYTYSHSTRLSSRAKVYDGKTSKGRHYLELEC